MREAAAKIAVGERAEQPILAVDHSSAAEALAAHLNRRVDQRGAGADLGHRIAVCHQLPDRGELRAQSPAGVEGEKIRPRKTAPLDQRNRQRVAQHRLHRG